MLNEIQQYLLKLWQPLHNIVIEYVPALADLSTYQISLSLVAIAVLFFVIVKDKPLTSLLHWAKQLIESAIKQSFRLVLLAKKFKLYSLFDVTKTLLGLHQKRYQTPRYLALSLGAEVEDILKCADVGQKDTLTLKEQVSDGDIQTFHYDLGEVLYHPEPKLASEFLRQYRPERPIDGFILFISVNFLQQSTEKVDSQTQALYQQIKTLQQDFSFILPIYLVLTENEKLAGFNEFWQFSELKSHYSNMIGWSNPHDISLPYNKLWLEQGLKFVGDLCRQIQPAFIVDQEYPVAIAPLLYPSQLTALSEHLTLCGDIIFSHSRKGKSFIFRGLYVSGKLGTEDKLLAKFIEQLLSDKIFRETNIAYAPIQKLLSSYSKLRWFQYSCGLLFLGLLTWFSFDVIELNKQAKNLEEKIRTLPSVSERNNVGRNIHYVNRVLNHVGEMDANSLNYYSIPWSWGGSFNKELTEYFAKNIFGDIVFPAFECRSNRLLHQQLLAVPNDSKYITWLETLNNQLYWYHSLTDLMESVDYREGKVASIFSSLVDNLYELPLSNDFSKHSSLYYQAISAQSYQVMPFIVPMDKYKQLPSPTTIQDKTSDKKRSTLLSKNGLLVPENELCLLPAIAMKDVWQTIDKRKINQFKLIKEKVAAPRSFFNKLTEQQSLPALYTWYQQLPDFSIELARYKKWIKNMRGHWLGTEQKINLCLRYENAISELNGQYENTDPDFINGNNSNCQSSVLKQFNSDNNIIKPSLYLIDANNIQFSVSAEELFTNIDNVLSLSFVEQKTPSEVINEQADFFWSVDKLNYALDIYDEYQTFAQNNYPSITLPKSSIENTNQYIGQALALKQLQLAMTDAVNSARINATSSESASIYQKLDQREATLASHIANFVKAKDILLSIREKFSLQEFTAGQDILNKFANTQALYLLKQVTQLYQNNKLYSTLEQPYWQAHQYSEALLGIYGEQQLSDYLASQGQRLDYITINYAQPLVMFLQQTNYNIEQSHSVSFWANTLVSVNKHNGEKPDPANSQTELEMFFNNQLFNTNQSNCFKNVKTFKLSPKNNAFAEKQNLVISDAKEYCERFRADMIEQEYSALQAKFTSLLATHYPFTSAKNVDSYTSPTDEEPEPVTIATIKTFLLFYQGSSSGLAQRLEVLLWAKRDSAQYNKYQQALTFVNQLDKSVAFFSALFSASEGAEAQGIELLTDFNVLPQTINHVEHIGLWQLSFGGSISDYPTASSTSVSQYWLPEHSVSLRLHWASNSPYNATAINGKTEGEQLIYQSDGLWSLLRFIEKYRSNEYDETRLNSASIILNFTAILNNTKTSTISDTPSNAKALIRINLYGLDSKTKQRKAINIPQIFPAHAPLIGQGEKDD